MRISTLVKVSIILPLIAYSSSAVSWQAPLAAFADRYKQQGLDALDCYVKYPECRSEKRCNATRRSIKRMAEGSDLGDLAQLKKFMHASDMQLKCANSMLQDQGLFDHAMNAFEEAGAATHSRWGRSKCYNTTPYGTQTWQEAHAHAVKKNRRSCAEYNFKSHEEWLKSRN